MTELTDKLNDGNLIRFALDFLLSNLDDEVAATLLEKEDFEQEDLMDLEKRLVKARTHADLHLTIVTHKYGTTIYYAWTEDGLKDVLYSDYVAQWWEQDGPNEKMPKDRDKAIDRYFNHPNSREYVDYDQFLLSFPPKVDILTEA